MLARCRSDPPICDDDARRSARPLLLDIVGFVLLDFAVQARRAELAVVIARAGEQASNGLVAESAGVGTAAATEVANAVNVGAVSVIVAGE